MNASVKLLEAVIPTSASLRAVIPEDHPSARILGSERSGSATFVEGTGLLVTVNYVVVGASSIEVTLVDGTKLPGRLVAQDYYSGLALLRVPGKGYPTAGAKSSADLGIGQEVFILASVGDRNRRVNSGVVSSLAPFDAYWEYRLDRGILSTAMNPGLGGGAMFDAAGGLVGVVSLDLSEVGRFTLAIPMEHFLDHKDELLQHGARVSRPRRAWVGLFCYELKEHVVIGGVLPGGPSESAGLQPGDVILVIDGERIHARNTLYRRLWVHKPGDLVTFEVFRDNKVEQVPVLTADAELFFA